MDHQRVRPPAPGVAEVLLLDLVNLVSCFDLQSVGRPITATLEAALHAVADPTTHGEAAAIDGVSAFMRQVDGLRGDHLPDAVADMLISAAQDLVSALDD